MAIQAVPDWRSRSTVTVEEVAPILGVGRSTAYVLARSGEIPILRLGRRILVPVAGLRRLLGEYPGNESSPTVAAAGPMTTAGGTSYDQDYIPQ